MSSKSIENWDDLRLPWFERTAQSPDLPAGSEGIAIWAPDTVSLRVSRKRIPLFGTVRLAEKTLNELKIGDRHALRAVIVGAIYAGSNDPFVGNAVLQAPLFPAAPGSFVEEYFSVDLAESANLPRGTGKIFAFASVGAFTSESRVIEVVA